MAPLRLLRLAALSVALYTSSSLAQSDPTQYPLCPDPNAVCQSYGIDFQSGGSYFQNVLSTANFTFVSQFSAGCQPDFAYNLLVDSNGDEYICTNTMLTPALVPELASCPILKDQLSSGQWSILVLSNNGNCAPLAVERDFYLSVGPEQTITVTPTIVVTTTPTPTLDVYATQTLTSIITAAVPYTTWLLNFGLRPTITLTPLPTFTVVRSYRTTRTITSTVASAVASVVSTAASCVIPAKATTTDPLPTITPNFAPAALIIQEAEQAIRVFADLLAVKGRDVPFDGEQRIRERKERIARRGGAIQARAPDPLSTTAGHQLHRPWLARHHHCTDSDQHHHEYLWSHRLDHDVDHHQECRRHHHRHTGRSCCELHRSWRHSCHELDLKPFWAPDGMAFCGIYQYVVRSRAKEMVES